MLATLVDLNFSDLISRIALTTSGEVYTWKIFDQMPVPTLVQELKGKRIVDIACSGERISSIYPFVFPIILLVIQILSQRSLKLTFKF